MSIRRLSCFAAPLTSLPATAQAHSFGKSFNLPVPFWMYAYGASAALLISFLILAFFIHGTVAAVPDAGSDLDGSGLLQRLRRWRVLTVLRGLSLSGLLLCLLTGFFGVANPFTNFNMTFFWIVFVLGFAYLTALIGDLYAAINPWQTLVALLQRRFPRYAAGLRPYPQRLAYWPALLFYMAFVWIELFGHTKPLSLALLLLVYSLINLAGAGWFGGKAWFRYCEFFGVFLRLVAKMAPLDYRPARQPGERSSLRLRLPLSGLLQEHAEHISLLYFAVFMLASTAFDGLHESSAWVRWFWVDLYGLLRPYAGDNPIQAYPLLMPYYHLCETLCLLISPFLYGGVFLLFVWLAGMLGGGGRSVRELGLCFVYTLLPIALAYNITHYYTLILTQGVQIVHLVSDPLGRGWNLFGTAYRLRAPIIPGANLVWNTQLALILLGHIASVYLAHIEALRVFPGRRQAVLSQLPMLGLMMLFTVSGLWILSQPINQG